MDYLLPLSVPMPKPKQVFRNFAETLQKKQQSSPGLHLRTFSAPHNRVVTLAEVQEMKFNAINSLAALTATAAGLLTASAAQAGTFHADFSHLNAGQSVEGLGTVHELLDISALGGGEAKAIFANNGAASAYGASSSIDVANSDVRNGGLNELGGFADLGARKHQFEFSFAEGTNVSNFSLQMFDYGDFNKSKATNHSIFLTAFNSQGEEVDRYEFSYESSTATNPLGFYQKDDQGSIGRGDAVAYQNAANEGLVTPGLVTFSVSGNDIAKVILGYAHDGNGDRTAAADPNIGFGTLTFETVDAEQVPEPVSVIGLLALGALGLGSARKR